MCDVTTLSDYRTVLEQIGVTSVNVVAGQRPSSDDRRPSLGQPAGEPALLNPFKPALEVKRPSHTEYN